jgi:hypothetical protein
MASKLSSAPSVVSRARKQAVAPLSLILLTAGLLTAQDKLNPSESFKFNLPDDSPLSILSSNYENSHAAARGGALVIDLHMSVTLRNQDHRRVRGLTMLIAAQEGAPGGRASQTLTPLDVGPNESFPVRIDVSLIRPLQSSGGPLVQVSLDGVLFDNLSFYGPDRLHSKRSLTAWEMENRRDRKYLKQILAAKGPEGVQSEMIDSINRQSASRGIDVQVTRGARVTAQAATTPDVHAQFSFLQIPDSPVQHVEGWAEISGNEARDARIQVRNNSRSTVRYVELGWLLKDEDSREFLAGSVPAFDDALYLPANQQGRLFQDASLKFSKGANRPLNIKSMRAYVSQVEFGDGKVWVPSREALVQSRLLEIVPPSPEEQRLAGLYLKKGAEAVIQDLSR